MKAKGLGLGIQTAILSKYLKWKFRQYDIRETIYISGSPRSGTTWLGDILAAAGCACRIHEPILRIRRTPEGMRLGLTFRPFVDPEIEWPEVEDFLFKLLSGKRPEFAARGSNNTVVELLRCKRLVVKFITMNRMLPWMVRRFPTRPPILILRHPCAVVASGLRFRKASAGAVNPDDRFFIEKKRPDLIKFVSQLKTEEEYWALSWAIDNYIPLTSSSTKSWILISYERLITHGQQELERIFTELHLSGIEEAVSRLPVPSVMAQEWSVDHARASTKER